MKKPLCCRILFYVLGLLILALGLTLNTKAGLGVSPIISISYSISVIFHQNFGDMTLLLYSVFVVIQLAIHSTQSKAQPTPSRKIVLLTDVLQLPLSVVFTRFLNLFGSLLPDLVSASGAWGERLLPRFLVLLLAILCTGVGAAMSLSMRIVPNPGDGIVQTIADRLHKNVGFTKNCFDLLNITVTILVGLIFAGHLVGIGVGTVLAVAGVGRVIALYQHCVGKKITARAGVAQ